MKFIHLRKKEGIVVFDIDADPIIRVVPAYDGGSTVCTKSGAKEYVQQTVEQVLAEIEPQPKTFWVDKRGVILEEDTESV